MASDIPEADAAEQAREVDPAGGPPSPRRDPEAPEADAIEQSQVVPDDDEHDRS